VRGRSVSTFCCGAPTARSGSVEFNPSFNLRESEKKALKDGWSE